MNISDTEHLKSILHCKFSEEGSNALPMEKRTNIHFVDFLDDCECMFKCHACLKVLYGDNVGSDEPISVSSYCICPGVFFSAASYTLATAEKVSPASEG